MSQKFSTFVNMINTKSNIEMQLATYKSMLTKASNDLAKSNSLLACSNSRLSKVIQSCRRNLTRQTSVSLC